MNEFIMVVGGLNAAANPNSKFAKSWAKSVAKASKPQPTPQQRLERSIASFEKKIAKTQAWIAECLSSGQHAEAQRWQTWLDETAQPWIEQQQAKLAQMGA